MENEKKAKARPWVWCFMFMGVLSAALAAGASEAVANASFIPGVTALLFIWGAGTFIIGLIKEAANASARRKGRRTEGVPPMTIMLLGVLMTTGALYATFIS